MCDWRFFEYKCYNPSSVLASSSQLSRPGQNSRIASHFKLTLQFDHDTFPSLPIMQGKKPVRTSTLTIGLCDYNMLKNGQWNGHPEKAVLFFWS
jgi:hypothetical protein